MLVQEDEYGVPLPTGHSATNFGVEFTHFCPCPSGQKQEHLYNIQTEFSRPHARPFSCLVFSVGTMWSRSSETGRSSWEHIADMVAHNKQRGLDCWFRTVVDTRTGDPYQYVGAMRDQGLLMGRDLGVEWVFMVDTDILPEPDLLVQLMRYQQPIIAPIILDPATGQAVGGPHHKPNTGLKPMNWVTTSMIGFKTTVLNCVGESIYTNTQGENMLWQKFWHYGHRPWMDTDHELKMVKHATKGGSLPLDERWQWFRQVDERRRQPADWVSSVPDDPNEIDYGNGLRVYAPSVNGK